MSPSVGAIPALLLLALAGGFLFAFICERFRYPSLRGEGAQLYFFAVVFAVPLIAASRILLWLVSVLFGLVDSYVPKWFVDGADGLWDDLVGPLDTPALGTFLLSFVLGPIAALIWNAKTDRDVLAANAVEDYGGELEKFLYTSINEKRLILVVLDSRKVYVGWPVYLPEPKARRDAPREHFRLLPARSGYLKDDTLEVELVTEYARIYQRIDDERLRNSTYDDFQVVIPLDHVMVARPYSLKIPRHLFEMRPGRPEGAEWWSPLHTLLTLLIVWRITRRPTKN